MSIDLKIVKIDNPKQTFKDRDTVYATFQTVTPDGVIIPVAVTHGLLKRSEVNVNFLKPLVGSIITIEDSLYKNPKTQQTEFTSAEQRVSDVVNKVPNRAIITVNPTNGSITTSESFNELQMDNANAIQAKVQVEEEKSERLARQKRASDNLRAQLGLQLAPARTETVSADAVLETNDDTEIPF